MKTIPLRYVGKKASEIDHLYGTGIVWTGENDVQDVPANAAALMLANHPDVWEDARSEKLQKKAPLPAPVSSGLLTPKDDGDSTSSLPPLVDLGVMDAEALATFAMREFNVALDAEAPIEEQRAKVADLMAAREKDGM